MLKPLKRFWSEDDINHIFYYGIMLLVFTTCQKKENVKQTSEVSVENRIDSLFNTMAPQEKIELFNCAGIGIGQNNEEVNVIEKNEQEKKVIRVAAAQFKLDSNINHNVKKMEELLYEASRKKVELIVFPETAITGYIPFYKVDKIEDICSQKAIENALDDLRKLSKKLSIAMAVGTAWKDENNVWKDRAFFIDDDGKILDSYDKIQLTGSEKKYFEEGKRLRTFIWKDIRLGMLICLDQRYPELWRLMRMDGAQLMLHLVSAIGSADWKVPVLEGTMRGHAASNGYYIVSANNAGPVQMVISEIYSPRGLILSKANYGVEEIIYSDIETGKPKGHVDFKNDIYKLNNMTH